MAEGSLPSLLFHRSPVPTLLLDGEGRIREMNPALEELLAMDRERLVMTPLISRVLPSDRGIMREIVTGARNGKVPLVRVRRGDGLARGVVPSLHPLETDGQGRRILVFLSEHAPERRGSRRRDDLPSLPDDLVEDQFTLLLDPKGVVQVALGVDRVHGLPPHDVVGRPLETLLHRGAARDELMDEILEVVGRGEVWRGVQWHRDANDEPLPVRVRGVADRAEGDGRVKGMTLVGRSVEAEFRWRRSAEANDRLAALGGLMVAVARELDGLLGKAAGPGPAEGSPEPALVRARAILKRLEDFTSGADPEAERIVLPRLVTEVVGGLDVEPGEDVQVRSDARGGSLAVMGDRRLLAAAVGHLVENGLRAARESRGQQGSPSLSVEPMGSGWVRIRISDPGPGVRDEWRERIFEPFFTTRPEAFGLGLPIARRIAELHGGRLQLEASGPEGSTFALELPPWPADELRLFHSLPVNLGRHRSVLLVDDEASIRRSVGRFLERMGYEMREAWSGRSALGEIYADGEPDLLVTDLKMNDGTGFWLLDRLRGEFPELLRRTVVITGDAEGSRVELLSRETGCRVLAKPLDLSSLVEILEELVSPGEDSGG